MLRDDWGVDTVKGGNEDEHWWEMMDLEVRIKLGP